MNENLKNISIKFKRLQSIDSTDYSSEDIMIKDKVFSVPLNITPEGTQGISTLLNSVLSKKHINSDYNINPLNMNNEFSFFICKKIIPDNISLIQTLKNLSISPEKVIEIEFSEKIIPRISTQNQISNKCLFLFF